MTKLTDAFRDFANVPKKTAHNYVQHLWVSWKQAQRKPYFSCGVHEITLTRVPRNRTAFWRWKTPSWIMCNASRSSSFAVVWEMRWEKQKAVTKLLRKTMFLQTPVIRQKSTQNLNIGHTLRIYVRTYGASICVSNMENVLFDRIYSHTAHFGTWQAA